MACSLHIKKSQLVSIVEHLTYRKCFILMISPPQGCYTNYDFFDFYPQIFFPDNFSNFI